MQARVMKLPKRPVVKTKRLIVRPIEKADLPALFAVNGDAEVVRYTPHAPWKTPADGRAWFSRVTKNRKSGAAVQFVIAPRDGGRPIGTMVLFHFDEPAGAAEVGYSLAREHWGRGLMTEALAAFADFCFETAGLKRLEARLDPRNPASARVLRKTGFLREGLQRRNYFAKGEFGDTELYGLLSEDPRRFGAWS
ncbi:MAG TPA: GNAT family N-acetyltransferase [Elusimicrobiota bacterium]|jgi:RimJ/RimL family protein N-acetyltransferase|nr:GNAT family N-acetyltransferase [Elusimicrobiota bacterium]